MSRLRILSDILQSRFLSSSSLRYKQELVARVAGRGMQKFLDKKKERLDAQSHPQISPEAKGMKKFEPFPYKITEENRSEVLKRLITPLYDIPYTKQLETKETYCRNAMRTLGLTLIRSGTPTRLDVKNLPCPVNPIIPSPVVEKFRNYDRLVFWEGLNGKVIPGFYAFPLGKHGDTVCLEPYGIDNMKDEHVVMYKILYSYFDAHAGNVPICKSLGSTEGGWRNMHIRSSIAGDMMLIGILNPTMMKVKEYNYEKDRLTKFVVEQAENANINLRSIAIQPCTKNYCPLEETQFEITHGEPFIIEQFNNLNFRISPHTDINRNSLGYENLYKKVVEDSFDGIDDKKKPLVLDLYSGVGAIAMHVADRASEVIAVESNLSAAYDAQASVKLNNIQNVKVVHGKVETLIESLLNKYSKYKTDTIAICHPPKRGMTQFVAESLRNCQDIKRIVYVTFNLNESNMKGLVKLCSRMPGNKIPPFVPIVVTPLDVSPNEETCELVITLERLFN